MAEAVTRGRGKSGQKRLQIMDAARKLFLECNFEGVSMETIAQEANVSKQTVYSHFGSKEDLFTAVIENECASHQLTDELFDIHRPVAEVLLTLAEHFTELLLSERAIKLHRVCATSAERSSISELFWTAGPEKLQATFQSYLGQLVEQGELSIDNLDFAAQQFLFMVKGEAQQRKILGLAGKHTPKELHTYLQSCVNVFLSAYSKPCQPQQ